ncbi:hypothetical protein [Bdellovibrio sp. HCB-110]|uniref:hypothetical protein n=1 Tax=Bdellovibrio sp. HCB-110 TaxID=3391182 RepID=UPI0039B631B8
MLKRLYDLFDNKKEKYASVEIEAFIEFSNGTVFGKIYKISSYGFAMLTSTSCDDLPSKITVAVNINGKFFPAVVLKLGANTILCKFQKALSEQELMTINS